MLVRRRLIRLPEDRVVVVLDPPCRAVASTPVGGGIGEIGSWLNLQVPLAYARMDPEVHLAEESAALDGPVAATMTAAAVADVVEVQVGDAWVVATVGVSVPLAAAGGLDTPLRAGTINTFALLGQPLTDAGLVNAVQTLTEAKAQALAEGLLRAVNHDGLATGTATDSVAVACAPGPHPSSFAGPASRIGHDLAHATHTAITEGLARWRTRHPDL